MEGGKKEKRGARREEVGEDFSKAEMAGGFLRAGRQEEGDERLCGGDSGSGGAERGRDIVRGLWGVWEMWDWD